MRTYFSKRLKTIAIGLSVSALQLGAQVSYSFTPCGATGQTGPTQGAATTFYSTTNLAGMVTIANGGYQLWTVPASGNYQIRAIGASGASVNITCGNQMGGRGADMSGEFNLTAGQQLIILVGQRGTTQGEDGGGGGGSYVTTSASVALVVAGGGGGASNNVRSCGSNLIGLNASTTTAGTAGAGGGGAGGTNGSGGMQASAGGGGAGGGFTTDGQGGGNPGKSFINGAVGGTGGNLNHGGFGGGGSGWYNGGNGGGGGGYSGGGTTGSSPYTAGGGGGSYNSGNNQTNTVTAAVGDGTVIITKLCNVNITAVNNPICAGQTASLSTNAASNILWSTGSTAPSITVAPSTTTSYTVTGQASTGCTTEVVMQVTVNPIPSLSAAITPSVLCVGKAATVTAMGANTFTWTGSGPSQTFTVDPTVTTDYNFSGTFTLTGCTNTAVASVIVNTNVVGVTANTTICKGKSINLDASGANSYTWSTGSMFMSTSVTPSITTTYTVMGTDQHNCVTSSMVMITVSNEPPVTASTNKSSICKGESVNLTSTGANTYTWSNGQAGSSINVTLPVDVVYTYTVTGTDNNGCTKQATVSVTVSKCSGIDELSSASNLVNLYPNPTSGEITLSTNSELITNVDVVDISGRTVISTPAKSNSLKVDMAHLSNGIYYVKVSSQNSTQIIKVLKSN